MSVRTLVAAWLVLAAGRAAAAPAAAYPRGAEHVVGTVVCRLGECVVLRLREGARPKAYEELRVGRPERLVVRYDGTRHVRGWRGWQALGTVRLRGPLGGPLWVGCVLTETERRGPDGQAVPVIRPGDLLHRAPPAPRAAP